MSDKLTVRGLKRTEIEPLAYTAIANDTFYISWEMNSSWSLQFTIKDDGSLAYAMLDAEASLFFDGQEYIIKQCTPSFTDGINSKDIVATHVYSEVARVRKYKQYVDQNGNATQDSDQSEDQQMYAIDDVLKFFLDGNNMGFSYQVIGDFPKARIAKITDGSGSDMLSKIVSAWPNAVIYPDNRNIRVYTLDAFMQDHDNRLNYQHDVTSFKLTYDSTSLSNEVYCVGGTIDPQTSAPGQGAGALQADARKYLGVPYVYGGAGGARGGNPYNGMDCSSFVSQVYKDFGINIPAYTVSMEPYFHEVSLPQAGDVGFYGPHGGSTHICLFLDSNTMIYEPQPGESCKEEPLSYYPPSWFARNDQMAKIVGSDTGDDDSGSDSTDNAPSKYYFTPFWVKDQQSIDLYGEYPMEPIEDDRFHDSDSMKTYALAKLQPQPALSVEATTKTNFKPIAGDKVHCLIRDYEFGSNLAVVGFSWYPYLQDAATTITLNTNAQNILDYQHSHTIKLGETIADIAESAKNSTGQRAVWTQTEVTTFGRNANYD